jgi:hypothetical protein
MRLAALSCSLDSLRLTSLLSPVADPLGLLLSLSAFRAKDQAQVWVIIAIIWAASDQVGAGAFVTATTALTFGYLISRGIAKASRVLEQ